MVEEDWKLLFKIGIQFWYVLLEFPFTIIQRANLSGLEPPRDAMEMKRVLRKEKRFGVENAVAFVIGLH